MAPAATPRSLTSGDWNSILSGSDRCGPEEASLLRDGSFEPGAEARVFSIVQAYCERCLNARTGRLLRDLANLDPTDGEGFAILCRRYTADCDRLLALEANRALPAARVELAREVRDHVSRVLAAIRESLAREGDGGSEEALWSVTRLERCRS